MMVPIGICCLKGFSLKIELGVAAVLVALSTDVVAVLDQGVKDPSG
jgi:hypothetical protein